MRWKLRVVLDALVLLLLVALDVRDLWYKTQWLGPSDAFAYTTKNSVLMLDEPGTDDKISSESVTGWRVFHDTCMDLRALTGRSKSGIAHSHYLHVLAANCSAPEGLTEDMAPQFSTMILTSDMRADAMAWAACKLLYVSRRPPLCQDAMISNFLHRYRFGSPQVTSAMMATPMSGAERELRALLDVIGKSMPLSSVVCVGGVELLTREQQLGEEDPLRRIFACASPKVPGKSAAFVGQFATGFAPLMMDKARLTADEIDVLGLRFIFRQNAVRTYKYLPPSSASAKDSQHVKGRVDVHTSLNLSCSGFLYNVMILMDLVLLVMHAWSSIELLERLILPPLLRTPTKQEIRDLVEGEGRTTLFACSLVHSSSVAILTFVSALLSWLLVLPHTAAWALGSDESYFSLAWIHTFLSGQRVWVLLLQLVHYLWGIFVFIDEGRAYMLATRTFVSSSELVGAVAIAICMLRRRLLSILPTKHDMEHQRIVDGAAFPGYLVISNAFDDRVHMLPARSQNPVLWMIYTPLFELLLLSLLFVGIGLAARYVYYDYHRRVSKAAVVTGTNAGDPVPSRRPSISGFSSAQAAMAGYKRLPLEELLDVPIRSKHIVRSGGIGNLEKTVGSEQFLWPVQYLSHGVLLENDRFLSTRRGFYRVLPVQEVIDTNIGRHSEETPTKETNGSPKRRRYTTRLT
ncbi:Transmembrane protein [Phytophthora megakarya]|uniref:Transmembrane protein n=1 Tax=Phytophthora megakarya TaxID=4795 RepID=A0A225W135_9STRA|nr:Transmembrane protein [Phytophthora megakarya]